MARKNFNIFEQSKKITEQKAKVSDIDYLDNFDEEKDGKKSDNQEVEDKKNASNNRTEKRVKAKKEVKKVAWVRQSIIADPEKMKLLKDIVHTVKSTGRYTYSQKDALSEAIELLKKKVERQYGEIKSLEE